jgi:hypothetical protein
MASDEVYTMKRALLLAGFAALLFASGCPDPFIHDPVVIDFQNMPIVQPRGSVQAIPPSQAPAEYYMYNNRFYVVIDEPDYVYKDSWKGFGDQYRTLYKGLDPLPYGVMAYKIAQYNQYEKYRHYRNCGTGDQLKAPSIRRALPSILFRDDEKKE